MWNCEHCAKRSPPAPTTITQLNTFSLSFIQFIQPAFFTSHHPIFLHTSLSPHNTNIFLFSSLPFLLFSSPLFPNTNFKRFSAPQSNTLLLLLLLPLHHHGRCTSCSANAHRRSAGGISTASPGRGVSSPGGAQPLRVAEAPRLEHVPAVPAEPQAATDVGAVQWRARDRVSQVPRPVRED